METTEIELLEKIDASFIEAARVMELGDLEGGVSDEEFEIVSEARHHCGTCEVRTVMEVVWPSIENYIDWLKGERDARSE